MINNQQGGDEKMTNTVELEVAIKRAGITKRELAGRLGLSEMGLYKKINNITEFKASEIYKICNILSIEDRKRDLIFFNKKSD